MAFFSGTDIDTLNEKAEECNNVLSIVVNNAGTYVAKFTQQILATANSHTKVDTKTTFDYTLLGDSDRHETTNKTEESDSSEEYTELKMYDCDLVIPKDVPIDEEFKEVCLNKDKELTLKREKEKAIRDSYHPKQYADNLWSEGNLWPKTRSTPTYTHSDTKADVMATSILTLNLSNESSAYKSANLNTLLNASAECVTMFMGAFTDYYHPSNEQCEQIVNCISTVLEEIYHRDMLNLKVLDIEEAIIGAFENYTTFNSVMDEQIRMLNRYEY